MPHPAPELPGSRLALVVATARYDDPAFTQLRSPTQDAAAVIDVLGDPGIGGFGVTSVLDQPEYKVRRAVAAFLADRRPDDLVLVYLSCHGVLDAHSRLYFAAADTVKGQLAATGVESGWLLDRLDECRARRQVLVLDCCFSGSFARTKGASSDIDLERRLVGTGRGRAVLTASRAGEYSYEGVPLPGAVSSGSVFTAALVEGLRSGAADRDGDGYVTVDEAYTWTADRVAAGHAAQRPQRWLYAAEGEIVLARNPNGPSPTAAPPRSHPAAARPVPEVPFRCTTLIQNGHQTLFAHKSVHAVAFGPGGRLLASGGGDNQVRLWDPATGDPVGGPLKAHTSTVWSVAFSPDGRLLASGGAESGLRLWDPATGDPVRRIHTGRLSAVSSVAFSPDGRLLAGGSLGNTVQLWDPATGDPVGGPLKAHTGTVWSVAFSPDGRLLASGSDDDSVRLWDPATGDPVGGPLRHHDGDYVRSVAFSPDGRLLAGGSLNGSVQLWDPATGGPVGRPLVDRPYSVLSVAFSPDGRLLAGGGGDGRVWLWDPATGDPVGEPLVGHTGKVQAVAFGPDGRLLASGSDDRTIRVWAR